MEVVQFVEAWDDKQDTFSHTIVFLRDGHEEFYARTQRRYCNLSEIDVADLTCTALDRSRDWPPFQRGLTQVTGALLTTSYIKQPGFWDYDLSSDNQGSSGGDNVTSTGAIILQEAIVCESLKATPHPKLAKYHGCVVANDRITGLCFARYGPNLFERLSHGPPVDATACIEDVRAGMDHLHSSNLIHCDINPSNILSDGEGFVLADFDSCTRDGCEVGLKGGTDGWSEDFTIASREVDQHALQRLEKFLFTSQPSSIHHEIPTYDHDEPDSPNSSDSPNSPEKLDSVDTHKSPIGPAASFR